jgi:regulator of RNase E activity RraB
MTDNEIIKALECCVFTQPCAFDEDKFYCHHGYSKFCDKALLDDVLDLINRQKAEIERLKSRKEVAVPSMRFIDGNPLNGFNLESNRFVARTVEDAKAEAYKECIEKVKDLMDGWGDLEFHSEATKAENDLDNLLKELVGGSNEKT